MCGRYTRQYTWEQVRDFLDLRFPDEMGLRASYNVAPTHRAPIVRLREGGRELVDATWGLVPPWADDVGVGVKMINARAETVASKPAYRDAYQRRRCVAPISGFYEWPKDSELTQPHYMSRADDQIMCLAGLWEQWRSGATALETFTIITTAANAALRSVHPRMPVILEPESVGPWLRHEANAELLTPASDGVVQLWPVSSRVGQVRNNDASLIDVVEPERGLFN